MVDSQTYIPASLLLETTGQEGSIEQGLEPSRKEQACHRKLSLQHFCGLGDIDIDGLATSGGLNIHSFSVPAMVDCGVTRQNENGLQCGHSK